MNKYTAIIHTDLGNEYVISYVQVETDCTDKDGIEKAIRLALWEDSESYPDCPEPTNEEVLEATADQNIEMIFEGHLSPLASNL